MGSGKNLVRFNIQNAKYAIGTTITSFGTSTAMSLEADTSSKKVYGDGQEICTLIHDKGKNGTLSLNNICDDYEIAMGRKIKTANGLADISQSKTVSHSIYFETCVLNETSEGVTKTTVAKTWLFGCKSVARPSESYSQTTSDINESTFDLPFEVGGVDLMSADNTAYVDEGGNTVKAWQITVVPGDTGYEAFGNTVPVPKMAS